MTTTDTYGYLFAGIGFVGHLALLRRLARFRTPESKPQLLESWGKVLDPANYSEEGRRLLPWIWLPVGLFAIGVFILVIYS
jgi:hypothetical protein